MKNGKVSYHLFLLLVALSVLVSCRAHKNIVKEDISQTKTETVVYHKDTSRVITQSQSNMEESLSIHETTERETIHFDDSGRVQIVVKENIITEKGKIRTDRGSGSVISITGNSDSVYVQEAYQSSSQEKTNIKTDSRPIQGTEWFWVILSVAFVLVAVIYVLYNKFSKKWL